jgi:hypothetical protein
MKNASKSDLESRLDPDNLIKIHKKLNLWEKLAKTELNLLDFDENWLSDDASDILSGSPTSRRTVQKSAKKMKRAKALYLALQYVSFVRTSLSNQRFILAVLYSLEIPLSFLSGDAVSGMKARLNGAEAASKKASTLKRYLKWAIEDEELKRRRPDLTGESRAENIAKRYPKKSKKKYGKKTLDNSTIQKGIIIGRESREFREVFPNLS